MHYTGRLSNFFQRSARKKKSKIQLSLDRLAIILYMDTVHNNSESINVLT